MFMSTILHNKRFPLMMFLSILLLSACGQDSGKNPTGGLPIPPKGFVANVQQGEKLFAQNCASCHGQTALGSDFGPPLMHKVYKADHHADLAFYMAVKNGSQQHHWQFGDMPPIKGVTPEDVGHVVAYIRQMQRRVGL